MTVYCLLSLDVCVCVCRSIWRTESYQLITLSLLCPLKASHCLQKMTQTFCLVRPEFRECTQKLYTNLKLCSRGGKKKSHFFVIFPALSSALPSSCEPLIQQLQDISTVTVAVVNLEYEGSILPVMVRILAARRATRLLTESCG